MKDAELPSDGLSFQRLGHWSAFCAGTHTVDERMWLFQVGSDFVWKVRCVTKGCTEGREEFHLLLLVVTATLGLTLARANIKPHSTPLHDHDDRSSNRVVRGGGNQVVRGGEIGGSRWWNQQEVC